MIVNNSRGDVIVGSNNLAHSILSFNTVMSIRDGLVLRNGRRWHRWHSCALFIDVEIRSEIPVVGNFFCGAGRNHFGRLGWHAFTAAIAIFIRNEDQILKVDIEHNLVHR
jgi:hypothetical protein